MNHRNRSNTAVKENPIPEKKEEKKEEPIITNVVVKEEITPPVVKKKIYEDVALLGHTVECRDFRAICAKNNWRHKDKLTEMLSKFNSENYNL